VACPVLALLQLRAAPVVERMGPPVARRLLQLTG
jgi:hypothetical protein